MTEIEKLEHRVNLILPKLKALDVANMHERNTYIYIISKSLAKMKNGETAKWYSLRLGIEIASTEWLSNYLDKAEDYLKKSTERLF